jgi:hypothetical protein
MEAARHAAGRLRLLRRGGGGAPSHRSRSSRACRQVTYSGQRERQPNKNPNTSKKFSQTIFYLCQCMSKFYIIPLNIGTLAGLLSFGIYIGLYALGKSPLTDWRYLGIWIPVLFIFLAIRRVKYESENQYITYGRAFYTGMLTVLVMASLKAILIYLTISLTGEGIIDQYFAELERVKQQMLDEGQPLLPLMDDLDGLRKQFDARMVSILEFNMQVFGGLILSLIIAAFMYSRKKPGNESSVDFSAD